MEQQNSNLDPSSKDSIYHFKGSRFSSSVPNILMVDSSLDQFNEDWEEEQGKDGDQNSKVLHRKYSIQTESILLQVKDAMESKLTEEDTEEEEEEVFHSPTEPETNNAANEKRMVNLTMNTSALPQIGENSNTLDLSTPQSTTSTGDPLRRTKSQKSRENSPILSVNTEFGGETRKVTHRRASSREVMASLKSSLFQLQWIAAFAVVNFDLEVGPALETIYPDLELTKEEKTTICFASFPDSNSYMTGDSIFSFRYRRSNPKANNSNEYAHYGNFMNGYVYFRQVRDKTSKRGYLQKSVVLLSVFPYHGLFYKMASILGNHFFKEGGRKALELASKDISAWPPPQAGSTYEVPFLGFKLTIDVPKSDSPIFLETSIFHDQQTLSQEQIMAPVIDVGLYSCFKDSLRDLWTCWELLILGEPIVIYSSSRVECSTAVHSLVDLVSPITFGGDYRPYLTIQDEDFKAFTSKAMISPGALLGVTNPFFLSSLEHWPHFFRIGESNATAGKNSSSFGSTGSPMGMRLTIAQKSSLDVAPGLKTKHKCWISHDRSILKKIEAQLRDPSSQFSPLHINNQLRKHFHNLTERFLAPLNRYFMTLIPSNFLSAQALANLSRQGGSREFLKNGLPTLKPFNHDDFIKMLYDFGEPTNGQLKFKVRYGTSADWTQAYRRFLKSVHFPNWLQKRLHHAHYEMHRQCLEALCSPTSFIFSPRKSAPPPSNSAGNSHSNSSTSSHLLYENIPSSPSNTPLDNTASLSGGENSYPEYVNLVSPIQAQQVEDAEIVNIILFLKAQMESANKSSDPESGRYKSMLQARITMLLDRLPENAKISIEGFLLK